MIRTKTTLIVGAGASCELDFPDGRELLARIVAGFDFQRMGSSLETADITAMSALLDALAKVARVKRDALADAAQLIRSASRLANSIDAILEQHGDNPMVRAVGKVAIAHYILDAEANSPLAAQPLDPGDLPLRGNQYWLFQLASAIVNGVPRAEAERCLDNLAIICFNYDRSIEHYLPWALHLAFGMSLTETRELVRKKLRITHPYGTPGRLDWQAGDAAVADWGDRATETAHSAAESIRTVSEWNSERGTKRHLFGELTIGKRLIFLGFGFDPMNSALLFEAPLDHSPDVLVTLPGASATERAAIMRLLRRQAGFKDDSLVTIEDLRAWQLLRDYSAFLES